MAQMPELEAHPRDVLLTFHKEVVVDVSVLQMGLLCCLLCT